MAKDKNTYIIRSYPDNKTGVSRSRVYDIKHLIEYLKEMEVGEERIIKNNKRECRIKKLSD